MKFRRWALAALLTAGGNLLPSFAMGQTIGTRAFESSIPFTYERGRNTSVLQRDRPGYSPLGIRAGGFTIFPSLTTQIGATDNVYQTEDNKVGDALVTIDPRVQVRSNWSLHAVTAEAGGHLVRYFDETARNEDGWYVGATGRYDVSSRLGLNFGARTSRLYESQFSGAALNNVRTSVPAQASILRFLSDMRFARVRTALSADYSIYDFKDVRLLSGALLSQDTRDRDVGRVIGHVEYGLTPDAGVFVQLGYTNTNYTTPLASGFSNRDSDETRALAGVSLDISDLARGSFGVGYIDRNYKSPVFKDLSGVSLNGRLEYFPTRLTTVTLAARREIEDSSLGGSSGYFNSGAALRVDHELLRNVLLNLGADYEIDDYRGIEGQAHIFRTSGGARYLLSPLLQLEGNLSYGHRTSDTLLNGPELSEVRGTIGLVIHR